jgi:hypothetical protein
LCVEGWEECVGDGEWGVERRCERERRVVELNMMKKEKKMVKDLEKMFILLFFDSNAHTHAHTLHTFFLPFNFIFFFLTFFFKSDFFFFEKRQERNPRPIGGFIL